jgi:cytochrome c oxidase cbb3-type subunit IV
MFKHYFEQIEGIEVFPLIALFIFVLFFILLLVWVFNAKKSYISSMSILPLQDDDYEIPSGKNTLKKNSVL